MLDCMKKFVFTHTLGLMPGMSMPREPLTLGAALGLGAGMAALNLGGSFLGAAINKDAANEALQSQVKATKELMAYQQERYLSPKAQVKNLAEAGLMPSSMFGNTAPVNVGGQMTMPTAPTYGIDVGTQSLSDVAQMLVGAAQAKKAGVEVPNIEADTKQKVLENERKTFENDLLQRYGLQKSAADLALAEQNVKLALAQTDVALQEKALKQWSTSKEKALSEVSEKQRDILQKELDNKDIELNIRNRQGEANIGLTKSQSNAANAAAEQSRTQADVNRQTRRLQSALADVEEVGKSDKIASLLSEYKAKGEISEADYEEALQRLTRIGAINDKRDNSTLFREVDNFTEWLKSKVKIFGK